MAGYFKRVRSYLEPIDLKQTAPTGYLDPISVEVLFRDKQHKLGEGAFARVYEGRFRGQPCAVKVFKENVLKNKEHLEEHDLGYLRDLKAPNIVQIHGLWLDPYKNRNALSLVMELCDTSLYEYIKSHKARGMPKEDKLKILHDVTNAMIYLHDEHIVHGDLRSPNVLLVNTRFRGESSDNQPRITAKVTNFDLARQVDPKTIAHYTTTFAEEDYLPPEATDEEKFKDRKHECLTFSVDVFCFGPLAIELACMEFPKPAERVLRNKGRMVKFRDEIERREKYLKKINFSERMYTDLIVAQCMAERPEKRGSFLDLQLIIEAFQKKMKERPDHELLEEQQATISDMRRKMEENAKTLAELEPLREQLHDMSKYNEELQEKLQNREKDSARMATERVRLHELENQLSKQEEVIKDANRDMLNLKQKLRRTEEVCERLKSYEDQCRKSEAQLKEQEKKLRAAEEEKTSLSARLMKAEESLEDTKVQLEMCMKEKKAVVEDLTANNKRFDNHLKKVKGGLERDLADSQRAEKTAKKEVDMLKAQLRNKEHGVNSFGKQLTEAKTRADTTERQWRQLEGQLRTANTGIANLEKSKMSIKSELESIKVERNAHLQEKERLSTKNVELEKDIRLANKKLRAAKEEKISLSTRLTKAEESLEDTKSKLEQCNKENEELSRSLDGLQRAKTVVEEELHKVKTERDSALETTRELEAKLSTETDAVKELEEKWWKSLRLHSKQMKTLGDQCTRMEEKLKDKERMKEQAIQELEEMKSKADALEREKEALEKSKLGLKYELQQKCRSAELTRHSEDAKKSLQAEEEKYKRLEENLEHTQKQLQEMQNLSSKTDYCKSSQIQGLEEDNIHFSNKFQEVIVTVQNQKDLVSKLENEKEDLQKEIIRLNQSNAKLESDYERKLSELRIEHDRWKEQYERKREENYEFEDIQMTLLQRIEELERTTNPKLPAKVGATRLEKQIVPPIWSDSHSVGVIETVVPGPLARETELKKFCWIPFGIQTLTAGQEGGLFPLQPQSKELSEDRGVIMLEVPENAVNTAVCDKLCIRYGVIVYGPFDVPEGYQLGSMAVYIYFEEDHAVKPVLLHLPHWAGKDGESSLKCAIAPHRLEEGEEKFKFRLTEDGDFHSTEGSVVIAIDGHCSLFAEVFREGAGSLYYATPLEMEEDMKAITRIAVTYNTSVWIEIFKKYCRGFKVGTPKQFSFESEVGIKGKLGVSEGKGWTATVSGQLLPSYILFESHRIRTPDQLEQAVLNDVYPPSLTCEAVFSSELKQFGIPIQVRVHVDGTNHSMDAMVFTCHAYEERQQERPVPVGYSMFSPTSPGPSNPMALPTKQLTVQNLMPYLPELAPLGLQIAGHLDLTDEWASLEISHQDPLDRLQKLFTKWLGDSETEKCPHTWEYFISIVRAVGKGKLADKIVAEVYQTSRDTP